MRPMSFEDSNTYRNLRAAFAGESRACTLYRLYAERARRDGCQQIGDLLDETAGNEEAHAEIWFRLLHGGEVPDTAENLRAAAEDENRGWRAVYPRYAQAAKDEGYPDIADLFTEMAEIESEHEARLRKLLENIEQDEVFQKPCRRVWICMNCGHVTYGDCAPDGCTVCGYPQDYQQLKADNY